MILGLFIVLVGISLILIVIGLLRPSESAQALVGFFFLFLLSLVILNGGLQYETGVNVSSSYSYDVNGSITGTDQSISYEYNEFNDDTSHNLGLYLAIASGVGFAGVMYSVVRTNWRKE